jgi:hypothetical protein
LLCRGGKVIGGEQSVLGVPASQGSWRPGFESFAAAAAAAWGRWVGRLSGGGLAGQAVLEELLILAPPVLAEQRLGVVPRAAARHDLVSPVVVIGGV